MRTLRSKFWVTVVLGGAFLLGLPLGWIDSLVAATPQTLVDQAITYYNNGDYNQAVQLLQEAIKLNPSYARAHLWLGVCYLKRGNADQATAEFRRVISLAPESEDAQRAQQYLASIKPLGPPAFLADMSAVTGVVSTMLAPQRMFGIVYRKSISVESPCGMEQATPIPGIGPTALWKVVYNLQGRYVRFRALAGLVDQPSQGGGAIFTVVGDGHVLFKSQVKSVGERPDSIDLDVTGVSELDLLAVLSQCTRNVVMWADPAVYPAASSGQAPGPSGQVSPSAPGTEQRSASNALPVLAIVDFADTSQSGWQSGRQLATDRVLTEFRKNTSISVLPRAQVEALVKNAHTQFGVETQGILSSVDGQRIGEA